MKRFGILAFIGCLLAALPVTAQDFIGFDRSSFGSVVLSKNQSAGGSDIELELAVGSYNNESIRNYSEASIFAKIGLSVGRLDILTDGGVFPCTAFIVDKKYILTNYHCVPGILDHPKASATRIEAVQFVAGYTQQGVTEGTRTYTVSPTPIEAHEDLDYALLEVFGNPSSTYGMLKLAANTAADGDPYWVIGHPMGEAQRISREKCRANAPALADGKLLHTCDTLPGNSGSPVIDASLQMVVGLHHAGSKKDSVNFAIPMSAIIARSDYLTAALDSPSAPPPDVTTPVDPKPDTVPGSPEVAGLCDALYTEAKAYDACYAYQAYADQCANHPFIGFAKGYLSSKCSVPETPKPPVVDNTPKPLLRPWCNSTRLNPTEATICGNAYLAGLDEDLGAVYADYRVRNGEGGQSTWLRTQRDTCGVDVNCIANVVTQRIVYLRQPPVVVAPTPPLETPGNYRLSRAQCYAVVASRTTVAEARQFITTRLPTFNNARVFRSSSGFYGITVGTLNKSQSDWQLQQWKQANRIPSDSYCHDGSRFLAEVAWRSGGVQVPNTPPAPQPSIMYVANNSDGGLNVRSGPGTNYQILVEASAGTQLSVLARQGNWSRVRLPNNREGWVSTRYLTPTRPYVQECSGTVVNLRSINQYNPSTGAGFLAVRDQPSARVGKKVTEVYLGDRVRVLAQKNGWARIQCVSGACQSPYYGRSGTIGWSSQKYLNVRCN